MEMRQGILEYGGRDGGLGGDVTEEIVDRIGARIAGTEETSDERDFRDDEDGTGAEPDSWVDAVVTLIAVVIFGLGWVLVELEGAEAPAADYDAAMAVEAVWVASLDSVGEPWNPSYSETGWTDAARKNSK